MNAEEPVIDHETALYVPFPASLPDRATDLAITLFPIAMAAALVTFLLVGVH